jgi:hypothetical protein
MESEAHVEPACATIKVSGTPGSIYSDSIMRSMCDHWLSSAPFRFIGEGRSHFGLTFGKRFRSMPHARTVSDLCLRLREVCGVLERQGQYLTRRSSWAEQVVQDVSSVGNGCFKRRQPRFDSGAATRMFRPSRTAAMS